MIPRVFRDGDFDALGITSKQKTRHFVASTISISVASIQKSSSLAPLPKRSPFRLEAAKLQHGPAASFQLGVQTLPSYQLLANPVESSARA